MTFSNLEKPGASEPLGVAPTKTRQDMPSTDVNSYILENRSRIRYAVGMASFSNEDKLLWGLVWTA